MIPISNSSIREMLPDDLPGITVRELLTKIDGADPGPEAKGSNQSRLKWVRARLWHLKDGGLAKMHGSARFPPFRWTK